MRVQSSAVGAIDTDGTIREIVRRIAEGFAPEKIILFGSHARGNAGPDSDVDLLVVIEGDGSTRRQATEIDVALLGLDLPVDVIVVRPAELERRANQNGTVVHSVLREGKILYEPTA